LFFFIPFPGTLEFKKGNVYTHIVYKNLGDEEEEFTKDEDGMVTDYDSSTGDPEVHAYLNLCYQGQTQLSLGSKNRDFPAKTGRSPKEIFTLLFLSENMNDKEIKKEKNKFVSFAKFDYKRI